jgi:hypothetical protein
MVGRERKRRRDVASTTTGTSGWLAGCAKVSLDTPKLGIFSTKAKYNMNRLMTNKTDG